MMRPDHNYALMPIMKYGSLALAIVCAGKIAAFAAAHIRAVLFATSTVEKIARLQFPGGGQHMTRPSRDHNDGSADAHAIEEIDHVLVQHANAAVGRGGAD